MIGIVFVSWYWFEMWAASTTQALTRMWACAQDEESIYDKHWMNPTLWQDAEFMDSVRKPLRIHVKVYGNSDNNWLAVAPEWQNAVGFGTDAGKALKELEQKLRDLKVGLCEWLPKATFALG